MIKEYKPMAKNENITPRILSNESDTRYIELSTQFEQDVYWHPSVTITLAAFTDHGVMLHRMKSEETAIRFDLSTAEIQALITGYTASVVARERRTDERDIEPFADLDEHPF
jgi:hypothetical protein